MQELTLNSWEEFVDALLQLDGCSENLTKGSGSGVTEYYYRGQSDSKWELDTTLERFINNKVSLNKYYKFARSVKSRVETFTEKLWDIPEPYEFREELKNKTFITFLGMPVYQYFAYLRHHGFPSPLLDWTESPYVALFFAFRNIKPSARYVSVYVYQEFVAGAKVTSSNKPHIITFGPTATIHRRHFLQQSVYTMCMIKEDDTYYLANHEDVNVDNAKKHEAARQDLIWKFNLPSTEQNKVFQELNKMNINAYSLFTTVDSLMETAAREAKIHRFFEN